MDAARILVVGDVVTDVVVRSHGALEHGSDTPADIRLGGGGSAANLAAWLAHLGASATLVARVGTDAEGDRHRAELSASGVRVRLARDPERPTGTVVVLVDADGQRSMLTDRGANLALSPEDLPPEVWASADHLHLSGYALLDESSRPAALAALAAARSAGLTVSVDPSSRAPLGRSGVDAFLRWSAEVDYCLPNLDEARLLAGADDPVTAAAALTRHYAEVAVTLGPDGALWRDATGVTVVRPAQGGPVVDTTGAGDAFCAGFLASRVAGGAPAAALAQGLRLAGIAVGRTGGRPPPR